MSGAEANRATSGDLPQPQAHIKLQSKNFFDLAHGQSPGWQADPPFRGEAACHCVVQRYLRACGNHSGEAEHDSGIGLKLFGFIPEPVFTFIPESCSGSSRNTVRNHPGIAFTLPRIPQVWKSSGDPDIPSMSATNSTRRISACCFPNSRSIASKDRPIKIAADDLGVRALQRQPV
jgi:hypothetical protein